MRKTALILVLTALLQSPAFSKCAELIGDGDLVVEYNYVVKDFVFTGKVIAIKVNDIEDAMKPFSGATITFQVLKQYKGAAGDKIEVSGPVCNYVLGPCFAEDSMTFIQGQAYLVYAEHFSDHRLLAGVCDRTRVLLPGDKDILALDKILATPSWSFDKEKISELDRKYHLSDLRKQRLLDEIK